MIAICMPTRGMLFTRTMQAVVDGMQELNKLGVATKLFSSFDMPIPDGHNYCVEQAFQDPAVQRIFFIEEDMYLDKEAFVALATSDYPMVTLQYNDKNGRPHGIIEFNNQGEVVWCGLGTTCIKREVFDKLDRPFFEIKRRWKNIRENINGVLITRYERVNGESEFQYGGLDVDFCMRVREKGFKIGCLPEYKAHHFQLVELGQPHTNHGCHNIRQV